MFHKNNVIILRFLVHVTLLLIICLLSPMWFAVRRRQHHVGSWTTEPSWWAWTKFAHACRPPLSTVRHHRAKPAPALQAPVPPKQQQRNPQVRTNTFTGWKRCLHTPQHSPPPNGCDSIHNCTNVYPMTLNILVTDRLPVTL